MRLHPFLARGSDACDTRNLVLPFLSAATPPHTNLIRLVLGILFLMKGHVKCKPVPRTPCRLQSNPYLLPTIANE